MSKLLKILLILVLISSFAFIFYNVSATSDEENIIQEDTSSTSALSSLSSSSITSVSSLNNYSQANLELNNILSIILISIGVLLILFAISILIRLKK